MNPAVTPILPVNSGVQRKNYLQNLYSEHHGWLYAWLCKRLGCSHNAADTAQNTFLRLLSSTSLPVIKEPRGFLTTTASRLIIDEFRRKKVEQEYLNNHFYYHGEQAVAPSSEELTLATEKLTAVIHMLEGLPRKCQRAFLMSKFENMPYADIARELDVSVSMVQQYITRAKLAYYKLTYDAE